MDSGCVNFLRALWTLAAAERTKPMSESLDLGFSVILNSAKRSPRTGLASLSIKGHKKRVIQSIKCGRELQKTRPASRAFLISGI